MTVVPFLGLAAAADAHAASRDTAARSALSSKQGAQPAPVAPGAVPRPSVQPRRAQPPPARNGVPSVNRNGVPPARNGVPDMNRNGVPSQKPR
jgi:hypothetical protein